MFIIYVFFFFFKEEAGIRVVAVTGVQTCALPISPPPMQLPAGERHEDVLQRGVVGGEERELGAPPLQEAEQRGDGAMQDRKSTRLNSSHGYISYAVFCLKKKKKKKKANNRMTIKKIDDSNCTKRVSRGESEQSA